MPQGALAGDLVEYPLIMRASNEELEQAEREEEERRATEEAAQEVYTGLHGYIRRRWEMMRNFRQSSGLQKRLEDARREYECEYPPEKLAMIREMGGSDVFAGVIATKCRGAFALLEDTYFALGRFWEIGPTPVPDLPGDMREAIVNVVVAEVQAAAAGGAPLDEAAIRARTRELHDIAERAVRDRAERETKRVNRIVDDELVQGGFYDAFKEFLIDLPIYPYAVLKGPFVRVVDTLGWQGQQAVVSPRAQLSFERVDPFDFFWSPGFKDIAESDVIQRHRWTVAKLSSLLDVPGWQTDTIRVLISSLEDGEAVSAHIDTSAVPSPAQREAELSMRFSAETVEVLEYHGVVAGEKLLEWGQRVDGVDRIDPQGAHYIQAWVAQDMVLRVQAFPTPRKRHSYYLTSYFKTPGMIAGKALPDILSGVGAASNAALRNLVNNMGMASGPQVAMLTGRLGETEDTMTMFPWKIWSFSYEPGDGAIPPIQFFQPHSNAAELLGIYKSMTEIADELSAIPRYVTGSGAPGGAGRTASGLSMLMGNASKMLRSVAENIDKDVVRPALQALYEVMMLTGRGQLQGDANIIVKGASNVLAMETERARQLEFLQLTSNPIDLQITGLEGRAEVLRHLSEGLGLPPDKVVPPMEKLAQNQQVMAQMHQAGKEIPASQGTDTPSPGGSSGPQVNTVTPGHNIGGLR